MLGFTQKEVDKYLKMIIDNYGFSDDLIKPVSGLLKNYYNGYQFGEDTETLYNSTIITYFFKQFIIGEGEIPRSFIDTNLKTDISWIRRLTQKETNTKSDNAGDLYRIF